MWEILTYVESQSEKLNGVVEVYLKPLNDASYSADGEILGLDQVAKIFSNIEDIALINEALHKQLDERIRVDESDRVGDIFLNMSFALKLYSRYITNFAAARSASRPRSTRTGASRRGSKSSRTSPRPRAASTTSCRRCS